MAVLRNKILLADDPEILSAMERSIFTRESFSLVVTASGQEAFEIIEEQDPILAILSQDMTDLSGDQCCRLVKADPFLRSTPIFLAARSGREKEITRCRNAGCDEVISRPIDGQQLMVLACQILQIGDRAAARYQTNLPIRIGPVDGKPESGCILDLNTGGAFIQTDCLHPIDTLVALSMDLPGPPGELRCQARVAWVNHPEWIKNSRLPEGMGVQFIDLGGAGRAAIEAYLADGPEPLSAETGKRKGAK